MTAGTAPSAPSPNAIDRSDFRHILMGGTRLGFAIGAAVIIYLLVSRRVPDGIAQALLQTVVVIAAAVAATFLPAQWTTARGTEGIAAAAAVGLWGTIVFMAIDVIVLRPLKAYPWTWDAIGGGSTWWYLPIWWMLGTFVAWLGGLVTAARARRGGNTSVVSLALPVVLGALGVGLGLGLSQTGIGIPVAAGAGFTATLIVFAVVAALRKG
jgi:hypothetical protein